MTKKKSEKTEEKKVSEETVAEETETENTEEPAKDENADKIKALEDELSAQKDKYMRLAAEYDNYRKRTANEKLSIYADGGVKRKIFKHFRKVVSVVQKLHNISCVKKIDIGHKQRLCHTAEINADFLCRFTSLHNCHKHSRGKH